VLRCWFFAVGSSFRFSLEVESMTMKRMGWLGAVAIAVMLAASPAAAADKAQQQLMAEIRMLQEHQQQLQQMLGGLTDTLKTVVGKLDEQSGATRKAFADEKLLIDNVAEGVRVLREKADDTNVRLSSMTQELESLRQTIASMTAPAPAVLPTGEPAGGVETPPATGAPGQAPPTQTAPPLNVSPQRIYDNAFSDYTAGQYDLAILGFQTYIRTAPRSDKADDAQLKIGDSLYQSGKNREAIEAYQKVITDYAASDSVPVAYYKLGLTYEALKQTDLAKKAYETVIQKYNTVFEAVLAKQRLDNLNRK
jgi:tol-pal system protein YbgF